MHSDAIWHRRCPAGIHTATTPLESEPGLFRMTTTRTKDGMQFTLEGRLSDEWVSALAQAIEHMTSPTYATLELSGLSFIDSDGAALLRDLSARGASLVGGSAFVTMLISGSTR